MKNQAMTSVSSFVQMGNHSFLTLLMLTGAGCGDEQPLDWSDSDSNNEVFYLIGTIPTGIIPRHHWPLFLSICCYRRVASALRFQVPLK
jgi:hypothetical protein